YKTYGKRYPFEQPVILDNPYPQGNILSLAGINPRLWTRQIDTWKGIVIQECMKNKYDELSTDSLFAVLESYLGPDEQAVWDSFKTNFSNDYKSLVLKDNNPYNFVNYVSHLLIKMLT
ncbi:hypothetical protein ACB092_02G186400, partial [Castanea dentata]